MKRDIFISNIQCAPCQLSVGTSYAYRDNYNESKSYTIMGYNTSSKAPHLLEVSTVVFVTSITYSISGVICLHCVLEILFFFCG